MKEKKKKTLESIFAGYKKEILIAFLIAVGLIIRLYFIDKFTNYSGDLLLYADWGRQTVMLGLDNFYHEKAWIYAPPNYPPIINLIYSFAFRVYEHRYYFAQLHNAVGIPPAAFLSYFDIHGYIFALKLPGILADLGLAVFSYWAIHKLTKNYFKAIVGMSFLLFNPVLIFVSSVWGQYDSLIALFALLSFIFLINKKPHISIPLLFISLYIKPNWLIFIPLYVLIAIVVKTNIKKVLLGLVAAVLLLWIVTYPFAPGNVAYFTDWLFTERIIPTIKAAGKASVSAFNLHTLFLDYDISADNSKILGIPANLLGTVLFLLVYVIGAAGVLFSKNKIKASLAAIFTIAFGSYLFMTNMLERYFFAGFAPMVILMFAAPKLLIAGVIINLTVTANLIYAFFRRTTPVIADPFNADNFALMRIISLTSVATFLIYIFMLFKDIQLKILNKYGQH